MSSVFLVCHKIPASYQSEIPKSTYAPETFVGKGSINTIKIDPYYDKLSQPKVILPPPPLDEIPRFENKAPEFQQIDYRVNESSLIRDLYLLKEKDRRNEQEKAAVPKEFSEWQRKMREKDEEEKREEIVWRRQSLDDARKKGIKAKKKEIEQKLEIGRKMRIEFSEEIMKANEDIQLEKEKIKSLKEKLKSEGGINVEKMKHQKKLLSKEVRERIRKELRLASKMQNEQNKALHDRAVIVRNQIQNHTNRHGDAFKGKLDITETKFLAALTDEEASELCKNQSEEKRIVIENSIMEHRKLKEKKMERLISMLNEVTTKREKVEDDHEITMREKKEAQEREMKKKEEIEEEKLLQLELKIQKKRQQRIQEAVEMEEHTRQIDARNRYLALNKKVLATKVFQSQQDGKLRAAKERQLLAMNDKTKIKKKKYASMELTTLKSLLGM